MTAPQTYLRDGATMIEVAPHQFVNERSAVALGLAMPLPPVAKVAKPVEPLAPADASDTAPIMPDQWRL